jgi:sec-independent protein translocase protein TatA
MLNVLAIGMPGLTEWIIIGALGLLIFGKRLPEVGRSLGKGIVEFKKGLKGIEEDVTQVDDDIDRTPRPALRDERKNYKFDPETGKPLTTARFDPYTGKPIDADQPAHADEHPSPQTP